MNSEEGNLLESEIDKNSSGRHFVDIPGVNTKGVIISNDLICKSEDSPNRRSELEIIHIQVYPETDLVVKGIGLHPELPVFIIIRVILVT